MEIQPRKIEGAGFHYHIEKDEEGNFSAPVPRVTVTFRDHEGVFHKETFDYPDDPEMFATDEQKERVQGIIGLSFVGELNFLRVRKLILRNGHRVLPSQGIRTFTGPLQ